MEEKRERTYPPLFVPLKGKATEKRIVAFDIEGGGGYRGFVCGSIVSDNLYKFYTDREDMLAKLRRELHEGAFVLSHNLQYDLPLLESNAFPLGDLLFTPHGLLWAAYPDGDQKHRLFDSTNLFPRLSIEFLAGLVGMEKVTLPENTLRALSRGDPWSSYTLETQNLIRERVLKDAEILFLAVANLQELALSLGGELKPTIAGIAMDIYRRTFQKLPWRVLGPKTNQFVRPAYYGGRVENFRYGEVKGVNLYDVNSLYPYAQGIARFPDPSSLTLDFPHLPGGNWIEREGVAEAILEIPEEFIPVLPFRFDKKLYFPVGVLHGVWTLLDLRHALARGAEIKQVEWVLSAKLTFNPFEEFTETLFSRRRSLIASGSGQANLVKIILNSLYGRWGLNEENGLYTMTNVDHVEDWEKFQGFTTLDINGSLFAMGKLDTPRQPPYVNTLFAAQITSQARAILNAELLRQGENACYCDTDSIITTGEIPTGENLGEWRQEMTDGDANLLGPKEYALHNEFWGDRYVVKGLPPAVAEQYFKEGSARFYKALSIREAIARHLEPTEWIEAFRSHDTIVPKRQAVSPPGLTDPAYYLSVPFRASELAEMSRAERPDFVGPNPDLKRVHLGVSRSPDPVEKSIDQVLLEYSGQYRNSS